MGSEIDFLPVGDGNGDAICFRHGSNELGWSIHVIDGGFSDTAKTVIEHIEKYYGAGSAIAHMVLTHADNDHACGLIDVLDHFDVGTLWMNRPWLYAAEVLDSFHGNYTLEGLIAKMKEMHPYLIELEKKATDRGIPVREVFQGAQIGSFRVLAPSRERYVQLIPDLDKTPPAYKSLTETVIDIIKAGTDSIKESWGIETLDENPPATSASNETSVVQLGTVGTRTYLLTGDVGPEGLKEAADHAALLGVLGPPSFVQVPHHGSRRNVKPSILDRWLGTKLADDSSKRGAAFVSVGKGKDIYPRKKVKNAFMRRGYPVHATRGITKHHHNETPDRDGWVTSEPEPFSPDVGDE